MEEVSLREILEVIIKRKWLIIISVFVCVFVSFILSFFVLKPVYEAKATFMVMPIDIKSGINPNTTIIFNADPKTVDSARKFDNKMLGSILSQVKYPQYTVDMMADYMASGAYMEKVLKDLNIDYKEYVYRKNISVVKDDKTGLVSVSVKYKDPTVALDIRDKMISYLSQYMTEQTNSQLVKVSDFLTLGFEKENKSLTDIKKQIADFLASAGGENEISKLSIDKQGEYKKLLDKQSLSLQTLEAYEIINKELDNIRLINIDKMMNLQVISKNEPPIKPISPRKSLNLAVALMLGLVIGVFLSFFKEYWEKSGNSLTKITDAQKQSQRLD